MNFFSEIQDFANKTKAKIVYAKCVKANKIELARKIAKKYELSVEHDDCVFAFSFAIQSLIKK